MCSYMIQFNHFSLHFVPYNMTINLYMLGPLMEDQIGSYVQS